LKNCQFFPSFAVPLETPASQTLAGIILQGLFLSNYYVCFSCLLLCIMV